MRNFKFYSTALLILSVLFIGFSSCKKTCVIEGDNVDSGDIVKGLAIYPASGYMTEDMSDDYHITETHPLAGNFEMSTDNGYTRSDFNYSAYSILAYPMRLNCNFYMERSVVIDDISMSATYRITVVQCKNAKCSQQRYVENYIAVPAFPSNYTVLHDIQIIEQ